MTPEEYKRIKEAEKEHLRALKKLKTKLREVERQKKVADAMNNIQNAPGDEVLSTHQEMIDRLAMETVQGEARLEMALSEAELAEAAEEVQKEEEEAQKSDAELEKIRAQDLVRQIKMQMGLAKADEKHQDKSPATTKTENAAETDATVVASDKEVEGTGKEKGKTLDSTPPEELPEKTIGRIPRKK